MTGRLLSVLAAAAFSAAASVSLSAEGTVNRRGFERQPYLKLRPGEVCPRGWLREWCETARDGYLAHLDEVDRHFQIAWTTNCMRRGELLGWGNATNGSWSAEGGAYWFDGLVQFAWQMEDPSLKAYVSNRLDTVLTHMHPNAIGFVHWMDRRDPEQMKEIASVYEGWIGWASALLGRSISSYYLASGDERALQALNWAFDDSRTYEYGNGRPVPAGAWETYRLGHDEKVGEAMDAWCKAGPRWSDVVWRYARKPAPSHVNFNRYKADWRAQHGVLACETALSALRMSFWRTGNAQWRKSVLEWSDFLRANCLQPHGVPVADESWGYAGDDRGTETCTVAADLRLNEEMLVLLGDGVYGDRIEQAFYNAAAACTTADFRKHVYVQTPNRTVIGIRTDTMCPDEGRYYKEKHWPLCCTAALTRPIPDFIQHAWLLSTNGIVAALYAPTRLRTNVGGTSVEVDETTDYPFRDTVVFTVRPQDSVRFALSMRLPGWCAKPELRLNGEPVGIARQGGYMTLERIWSDGDRVELKLPMTPRLMRGTDRNAGENDRRWCSILAGPLLFAANLPGVDENTIDPSVDASGIRAQTPTLSESRLSYSDMPKPWRWDPSAAPVSLTVGKGGRALRLIPYGATRLRISMFDDAMSSVACTSWFDARIASYGVWPSDAAKAVGGVWQASSASLTDVAAVAEPGSLSVNGALTFSAGTATVLGEKTSRIVFDSMVDLESFIPETMPTSVPDGKCGLLAVDEGDVRVLYALAKVGSANRLVRLDGPSPNGMVRVVMTVTRKCGSTYVVYNIGGVDYTYDGKAEIEVVAEGAFSNVGYDGMGSVQSLWAGWPRMVGGLTMLVH